VRSWILRLPHRRDDPVKRRIIFSFAILHSSIHLMEQLAPCGEHSGRATCRAGTLASKTVCESSEKAPIHLYIVLPAEGIARTVPCPGSTGWSSGSALFRRL
jgi:hypothetical protein